ncbi:MAG TPA: DUF5103 domain-containing protein [Panacibacter sp.]|nr:DUF5103 domain-containing protein [Panacibacter sp.]HNP46396.1 DUF5103 domain-containing protein [Panacibacter sp.]
MNRLIAIVLLFSLSLPGISQREPDKVYMPKINGIKFFQRGNQMSYPVINLGAIGGLELHFDDLDARIKNYSYTWQLCDADWNVLDLNALDYIEGFTQNRITQYRVSGIAKVKYIHYQVMLPEQNCQIRKSGNYLLKVFLNGDTSKLAFTKRLLVVDNKVTVAVKIQQPYNSSVTNTDHKVQFSLDNSKLNILNPQQQLKVVVLQNFRWDNAIKGMQPLFMRGNNYEYNGERDFLFPAGKEFRWLDMRSFRYQSEHIQEINRNNTPEDVYVRGDIQRSHERWLAVQDYDGFFSIDCTDANNPWWQGDYGTVHFHFIPSGNKPYPGQDVYIVGQMTNYDLNDLTKLHFNGETGEYEISLLLKQGYYNYTYVTKDARNKYAKAETALTDGDYWETENLYTILVYYRSLGNRYDELVSAVTVNSRTYQQQ